MQIKASIPGVRCSSMGKANSVVSQEGGQVGWLLQHATPPLPPLPAACHQLGRDKEGREGEEGEGAVFRMSRISIWDG